MSGDCIPVEDLGRILALPEGDPGRAHLEGCSRCRSLAEMLVEFARPGVAVAESGFAEVDDLLRTTIADITGVGEEPARAEAPSPVREFVPEPRRRAWFGFPQLAGAFAALAIVAVAGVVMLRSHGAPPVMRGAPAAGANTFAEAAAREVAGGVEFTWTPVAGATAYQVIFLDESLREVARLAPVPGTSARLESGRLPAPLLHGSSVGWEVEALAGSDRFAVSRTLALRVP
jgi:hypothetical protein